MSFLSNFTLGLLLYIMLLLQKKTKLKVKYIYSFGEWERKYHATQYRYSICNKLTFSDCFTTKFWSAPTHILLVLCKHKIIFAIFKCPFTQPYTCTLLIYRKYIFTKEENIIMFNVLLQLRWDLIIFRNYFHV